MCRRVSAGCLCVDRFKKIVLSCVGVCRRVSAGYLCVDRFKKNCIFVCRCVSSCVGRSVGSRKIGLLSVGVCRHVSAGCLCVDRLCRCVSVCVVMCRQVVSVCVGE